MPTQVLIVEDHTDLAKALTMVFDSASEFHVCGVAHDFDAAIDKMESSEPDLVTVDINLPSGSGLDLIPKLMAIRPKARFLVISHENPIIFAPVAREAGVGGYLRKGASLSTILEVAGQVMAGKEYFPGIPPRASSTSAGR